jgi:regulator of chromosome condensation
MSSTRVRKAAAPAAAKTTKKTIAKKTKTITKKSPEPEPESESEVDTGAVVNNTADSDAEPNPPKAAPKKATKATTKKTAKPVSKAASKAKTTQPKSTIPPKRGPSAAAPTAAAKDAPAKESKKRKAEDDAEDEPKVNGVKKAKVSPVPEDEVKSKRAAAPNKAAVKNTKAAKPKPTINEAPTQVMGVYVCGEGSSGELGLGSAKGQTEVKRPRFNPILGDSSVVALSVGGMHTAVLTKDNKILTWGVNDQGALGRDTTWDGGLRDIDDGNDSDSDSSDSGSQTDVNPNESTPGVVNMSGLPDDIVFTQVACTDSATFALTSAGDVYGWGTFRSNEGLFGFDPSTLIQLTPKLIAGLKNVVQIAGGANHVVALQKNGTVYCWGAGQQNQLGRRILERRAVNSLKPTAITNLKKIGYVGAGAYSSFAVKENGDVYSWGLNNFGQTGIAKELDEEGNSKTNDVHMPILVESLRGKGKVTCIKGGQHHTIAVTDKNELLFWGRVDGSQAGVKIQDLPKEHVTFDSAGVARYLVVPVQIPNIEAVTATAGSDHCIAIDKNGKAWSWGFSTTFQTGQGTDDDVELATMIDNTAVRDKKLLWAGAGSQFSVLAGIAKPLTNGVH